MDTELRRKETNSFESLKFEYNLSGEETSNLTKIKLVMTVWIDFLRRCHGKLPIVREPQGQMLLTHMMLRFECKCLNMKHEALEFKVKSHCLVLFWKAKEKCTIKWKDSVDHSGRQETLECFCVRSYLRRKHPILGKKALQGKQKLHYVLDAREQTSQESKGLRAKSPKCLWMRESRACSGRLLKKMMRAGVRREAWHQGA